MMRTRKGLFFVYGGLLLLAAALLLTGYNLWDSWRAKQEAGEIAAVLESHMDSREKEKNEENVPVDSSRTDEQEEITAVLIDGEKYIGMLEIPALKLELPVMGEWSYPKLRIAPCRYTGSVYQNDMIIAGHNYDSHFGRLKELQAGDEITLTNVHGITYFYKVISQEILEKNAVEEMQEGDWDLTLFTCTIGGAQRITVRCERYK
ncbi:MAG: sortase [Enterocloster sp.]